MAYPLNNSFETASASGYWNLRSQGGYFPPLYNNTIGHATLTYNSAEQAYDIFAPRGQTCAIINEPVSENFWFEADIELVADPSNRRHFGLWITTGWPSHPSQGFRFHGLDNYWGLTYWAREFGSAVELATQYRDGELALLDPELNPQVGDTLTFRMEFLADPSNVLSRIIRCYVNGIFLFQTYWKSEWWPGAGLDIYQNKAKPGIFAYDCTVRVHAIRANEPSGIEPFPPVVGGKIGSLENMGFPYSPVGWNTADMYLNRINIPLNPEANTQLQQPRNAYHGWMHTIRRNLHFAGKGVITGTIKERVNGNDLAISRRVQLIEQASSEVAAETWSDAQGNYQFVNLNPNMQWTVVTYDHKNSYRAVIADNLRAAEP